MPRLIVAGGGHAHLSVLGAFLNKRPFLQIWEILLITPHCELSYSGMMPGWIAGHYSRSQCQIDLSALAARAGITFVHDTLTAIDAEGRWVELASGRRISFDLLSLDTGSEIATGALAELGARLLPVKPIDAFFVGWPAILAAALAPPGYRLVIVGAGAAGVEVAFAARHAFQHAGSTAAVTLVTSDAGVLPNFASSVQRRVARQLDLAGITLHQQEAAPCSSGLRLADGTLVAADAVIAATGARAPHWLHGSGLTLDAQGYIVVDASHCSVSHDYVFAAGDVCARQDVPMGRSGVHAVHAGPVLANNLLAAMEGTTLAEYMPRQRSLYLLSCGDKYAIASWGPFSVEGAWVWRWKNRIDCGFVARFAA